MKKIVIINAVVLVLITVVCFFFMKDAQSKDKSDDLFTTINVGRIYDLCRTIDYEAGVVCYHHGNAAYCLPIGQTKISPIRPQTTK